MSAAQLRQQMKALPEPPADSQPPYWDYWRHDLWQHVVSGEDPGGFAGWPSIYHTMRVDHWRDTTDQEYAALSTQMPNLLEACIMPEFGYPKDTYAEHYSAALIHQAHHLLGLVKTFRLDVANRLDLNKIESVFEVGGGYGQMALVLYRLGFRGRYTIFDLPEFALLQEYYLSNNGVKGVVWKTDPSKLRKSFTDLMIGCYSLSEMEFDLRRRILDKIVASYYLFLFTARFAEYGNMGFFDDLRGEMDYIDWAIEPASHLPEGNYYMFGRRQGNEFIHLRG